MREKHIDDVFAVVLPRGMDPDDPATVERLGALARRNVWAQYPPFSSRPHDLRFDPIDWLVTNDPDKADAFQPAHDCEKCQAGNDRVRTFLAEHPDRYIVLGNLHYVEVWDD